MKYEKSLAEVLQWKEEASNLLYNLTIHERLKIIREGSKIRLLQSKNVIIPPSELEKKPNPAPHRTQKSLRR